MNNIIIDTRELDRIAAKLNVTKKQVVKRMAFQVESLAKIRAAKDTGAMRNSIYVATQDEDGYGQASSAATSANPSITTEPNQTPSGNVLAVVGPCVTYAEFIEFGTSKRGPRPFLTPALEQVGNRYNDGREWEAIIE